MDRQLFIERNQPSLTVSRRRHEPRIIYLFVTQRFLEKERVIGRW